MVHIKLLFILFSLNFDSYQNNASYIKINKTNNGNRSKKRASLYRSACFVRPKKAMCFGKIFLSKTLAVKSCLLWSNRFGQFICFHFINRWWEMICLLSWTGTFIKIVREWNNISFLIKTFNDTGHAFKKLTFFLMVLRPTHQSAI